MKFSTVIIIVLFTLLTFSSSLPMNQLIDNQNKDILNQNQSTSKNLGPNQESKIDSIVNYKTSYNYGDIIRVSDVVNMTHLYNDIYHTTFTNQWYAPDQQVQVYIGVDPCQSRDSNYNCIPGSTGTFKLSDFQLSVNSGSPVTNGTSTLPLIDDYRGIWLNANSSSLQDYTNALSYNFTVKTPSQTVYNSLIGSSPSTIIYEFYPGNKTNGIPGWDIKQTPITFSADSQVQFIANATSSMITVFNSSVTFDYHLSMSGNNLNSAQVDFNVTDGNQNNKTVCTDISSCLIYGFTINQYNETGPSDLTGLTGHIYFTVSFTSLNSVNESTYFLNAKAVLINPTAAGALNYGTLLSLTQNKTSSVKIIVNYNLQTPLVGQAYGQYPGGAFSMFPFNTSNPQIRPGDYFDGLIHTSVLSNTLQVSGASLSFQLYDAGTQANYTSQLNSGSIASISYPDTYTTTNSSGLLRFRLNLGLTIPLRTYNLVVTTHYSQINSTPYWIKTNTVQLGTNYTFTLANLFDSGFLTSLGPSPSNNVTLTTSNTSLTFAFLAQASYNSIYKSYAIYYNPNNITSDPYPLINFPLTATIIPDLAISGTPLTGVNLVSSTVLTNNNGIAVFTLTTKYPDRYNLTTFQLNVIGNYTQLGLLNSSYRFVRAQSTLGNTSSLISQYASFNPKYTVVGIQYVPSMSNVTTSTILRPGEIGLLVYQTYNASDINQGIIPYVPFNFSIIAGQLTPGLISNTTNPTYPTDLNFYESTSSGYIYIYFYSTYGVTPESSNNILIRFNVYLNITLFNKTDTSANFYLGTQPPVKSIYNDYLNTWSNNSQTYFNLQANYLAATPVWVSSINDFHVLDNTAGLNLVRPNNETIKIRLYVEFTNGTIIQNVRFPVNVTMITTYPGAILTIADPLAYPLYSTGYYETNYLGYIEFNVTIMYYSGYPKAGLIQFNATVGFGAQVIGVQSGYNPNYYRWIIGNQAYVGYNKSQLTTGTFTNKANFLNMTISPAYLYGQIVGQPANSTGVTPSNPLTIQPNNLVTLPFKVTIQTSSYATKDGLGTSTNLNGIKVYLNETILYGYNMTVAQNGLTTNSNGLVYFQVDITNKTADGTYIIPAYADFENDQGLSGSIVGTTQTFNYNWLNGTVSSTGLINSTTLLSIKNYSPGNSASIVLKRARTMGVYITGVFDTNLNPVGVTDFSNVTVLRGYTLQLSIVYKDTDGTGLAGTVHLITEVNDPNPLKINRTVTNFPISSSGQVTYNLLINNTYNIGKATIIAVDQNLPSNTPFVPINTTFNIDSKLRFFGNPTYTITNGYNEVMVGENITVSGAIYDEVGPINTSYYNSNVINEFINNLRITGYNTANVSIPSSVQYYAINVGSTNTTFQLNWAVPLSYSDYNISIQIDFDSTGIKHFIVNDPLIPGSLPAYRLKPDLQVFQSVTYKFSLSNTNAINVTTSGNIFVINLDYTSSITINGYLLDNFGRLLANRIVRFNVTSTLGSFLSQANTGFSPLGYFSHSNFIGASNLNVTYNVTLYYIAVNGSLVNLLKNYVIRTVTDTTPPTIGVLQGPTGTYQYQNISFYFNLTDPSSVLGNLVGQTGINKSSVQLLMNGTVYWDGSVYVATWTVPYLNISWDYSSVSNNLAYNAVNLTLVVRDNAGNSNNVSFIFKIDRIAPTFFNITPSTNVYLYQTNYQFSFDATDQQTGLNPTSAGVYIDGVFHSMTNTSNYYISAPISFYRNMTTFTVYFTISDLAGNVNSTTPIIILVDSQAPTILNSNTNLIQVNGIDYAYNSTITFAYNVTDAQTGVNSLNIFLLNSANQVVFNSSQMQITNNGAIYTISGTLNRNNLNLSQSVQTLNFEVFDNYGNPTNQSLVFRIDILGPLVSKTTVYQPDLTTQVVSGTNLTATMQYVTFDLTDQGTPATGIDTSNVVIQLTVNKTFFVTLTFQNGLLQVSNSTLATNFTINFTTTSLTIGWNATSFNLYGISQTYSKQQVPISWQILTLKDKFGNNIISNTKNTVTYYMEIPALPPPPNIFVELASLALTFGIFIVIGVAAAYVFEKIRYIG